MTGDLAKALFAPDSVALIGASGNAAKNASRPQRFLSKHGFAGRVYPVNPGRRTVRGVQAYASVRDVEGPVEHAYVMVPADKVPRVVRECCQKGVRVATIFSDGFAESGEKGAALQDEVVSIAHAGGLRILGPNSMGVISTHAGLTLSVNACLEMETLISGNIGLVSQSGTILGTVLSRGASRNIGYSNLVSMGNEADLSVPETVDLLVEDRSTEVIVLFLEAIRDHRALARAARRAYEAGKPVIAYKLGRSSVGRDLAMSHSGAIAGTDRCVQAFMDHHGIVRIDMLENLFECAALLRGRRPVDGRRVSVLTTTGGGAATVVDRLGATGLELVGAPESLHERLAGFGLTIGRGGLVDLTMAGTRDGVYQAALEELMDSPDCDAVVAVVGSSGQFHPELAVSPIVQARKSDKFLAAFIAPQADESLARLAKAGIAAFRTPEACADAVRSALNWRAPAPVEAVGPVGNLPGSVNSGRGQLDEVEAARVFAALGVPHPVSTVLRDANSIPSTIKYPVAVKVLSRDIQHKTDAGGVRLSVANEKELKSACREIGAAVRKSSAGARIDGYLVQTMEEGGVEVLLGYRVDAEAGPVVVLGAGGLMAEIYDDVSVRLAPVSRSGAEEMIAEVSGLSVLSGYRGRSPGDVPALVDAVVAVSRLAGEQASNIVEAEINPLLVRGRGKGVVALDGLIICRGREGARA